ncbi:MAG: mannan endo-1,4-beta-mannosidase A and B [Fibrobacteres bacterium]|nr:mannan endo-1,4-beta-mannosidase A and B [Fibrobacterota bacterium]
MGKMACSAIRGAIGAMLLASAVAMAATPVSPNASPEAKALLNYLYEQYGKKTLSGQMFAPWAKTDEAELMKQITGKYPAIRGQDLISESANKNEIQQAIAWWKAGGIPTVMWHWGAPTLGEGYENSKGTIDVAKCFQEGSAENKAMWADLKRIADHLTVLRDAKVPVLWRPMHENDGGWFWYGKGGGTNFVKLWRTMFDYFTKERKLDNLIWVMCHSGTPKADWNPGAAYVDIAGGDTYASTDDPQAGIFKTVDNIYGRTMPKTLHECGILPDPDKAFSQGATWSWWMLWHTSYAENHNRDALKRIYAHEKVITRDELPNWPALVQLSSIQEGRRAVAGSSESLSFAYRADGLSLSCGSGGCGSLSLISIDGRSSRIALSPEGFLSLKGHRPGVHLLREVRAGGVREAMILVGR